MKIMIPHWTKVRVTEDVPCSYVELGDEGTIIDDLTTLDDKQFYILEVESKKEIVVVSEDTVVNVDLN